MSNQLIKTTEQGKENVFPRTRIQDLFDDTSGQKLIDILNSFNMMFVPYLGNKSYTRNQISPELRRQGLWLTYVIDNTVYTEWYDEAAIDDTNWGSDSNWRQGSNALVGDLSVSPNGTWVINGEDSGISIKGDKGDSPVIRIYDNKIQVSYDKGVTYEDLNNTPVYTKFRFNSQTNTYQVSYDLGANWQDISDEKVYHKFRYNSITNTYQESTDFGKTWSNISAEKVYYQFRTNDNRLQVSTDLGITWKNCSEPIAAWFRWADTSGTGNVGKVQISRDQQNWTDLSPTMTNNLYIKGYVAAISNLPSNAAIGDIYMVGPTYDESDTTQVYPHYRMWIKQSSGWVDNGEYQSNIQIVQTTGQETGITMSQKAITDTIKVEKERILELEKSQFPLVVTLNLSNTLLEYTGKEQTVSVSYTIKHKGVLKLPKTLSLTQDGVVITNNPAKEDTTQIIVNKLGDIVVKLNATAHSYYEDSSSLTDDIISASVQKTIQMVLPIYAGFGTSAEGVKTVANKLSIRTSAAGTYTKTCQANGQNFYILVPATFGILTSFTMGGAPFVMETSDITLGDYEYKQYKSGAVYNTGATINIKAL